MKLDIPWYTLIYGIYLVINPYLWYISSNKPLFMVYIYLGWCLSWPPRLVKGDGCCCTCMDFLVPRWWYLRVRTKCQASTRAFAANLWWLTWISCDSSSSRFNNQSKKKHTQSSHIDEFSLWIENCNSRILSETQTILMVLRADSSAEHWDCFPSV